jgi:hypothetical protein
MSSTGSFVQVGSGDDGVGKLIEIRGAKAEIEYFVSPAGPRLQRILAPTTKVREVELSPQTRVFYFDEGRSAWWAGRVDGGLISAEALRSTEDHYRSRRLSRPADPWGDDWNKSVVAGGGYCCYPAAVGSPRYREKTGPRRYPEII